MKKCSYINKKFSILGDSISTLEGYNPQGYKVFYTGENCERSNVYGMIDTWWGKVIEFFGGELLVNNSWSGSRVTKLPNFNELFPSGCSDERTSFLHLHDSMFKKIRRNYPNSEIWCCTLNESYMSSCPDFQFPYEYSGIHIEKYNDVIRNACQKNKCRLVDLYRFRVVYDSIDGSHPTKEGMYTIAAGVIQLIQESNENDKNNESDTNDDFGNLAEVYLEKDES